MTQTQKQYEYDEVMDFCNTGNVLDQNLTDYQDTLVKLEEQVRLCEQLYHGKGSSSWQSAIFGYYEQIFGFIGDENSGAWNIAKEAHQLQCLMYTNAKYDKEKDNG